MLHFITDSINTLLIIFKTILKYRSLNSKLKKTITELMKTYILLDDIHCNLSTCVYNHTP